jgi:hypothetical protein
MRRYDEAHSEVDRALAIWTRAWGDMSPAVATGLGVRGKIAMAEGQPAVAEPDFRRALVIRRSKRGDTHPETVSAIEHLASSLAAQGKREAVALYEEALAAVDAADRAGVRALLDQAKRSTRSLAVGPSRVN